MFKINHILLCFACLGTQMSSVAGFFILMEYYNTILKTKAACFSCKYFLAIYTAESVMTHSTVASHILGLYQNAEDQCQNLTANTEGLD